MVTLFFKIVGNSILGDHVKPYLYLCLLEMKFVVVVVDGVLVFVVAAVVVVSH